MHKTLQNHIKNGFWANGYLLAGQIDILELADFLKKHGEVFMFDGLIGIDEIRTLKRNVSQSVGHKKRSFFIINTARMSRFVPQAILKTIEDLPQNKHLFVVSSNPDELPSTMRSRLVEMVFSSKSDKKESQEDNLSRFIKADYFLRAEQMEKIAEDKDRFTSFLNDLERHMLDKKIYDFLPKIREARESASIFNISRKMCLEYLNGFVQNIIKKQ